MSSKFVPLSKNKYVFNEMTYRIAKEKLPETFSCCAYKVTKAIEGIDVFVSTICDSQLHSFIVHFADFTPDLMKVVIQLDAQVPGEVCNEIFNTLPRKMSGHGLYRDKMRFHMPFCVTLAYYADVATNPLSVGNVPDGEYQYSMNPAELDAVLYEVMGDIIRNLVDMINDAN